ncbi:hypothetical protein BH23GEM3_BH23GEM3_13040 [soil metagenome]
MQILKRVGGWLWERLGLERPWDFAGRHPVQPEQATRKGWMYVFGAATMTAFLLQVVTGVALATKYVPSPASAYESLIFINQEVWLGWFVRGMHYFGASAMVVFISVHVARVFLTGSYKYPREMNWIFGVMLLVLTMLMAATGQLLRWDQNGIWTVVVGSQLLGHVPLIGPRLTEFVLAGDAVGGATLSRFFAFHILILPALIFLTVGVHLYLVLHHGVSEPPEAGKPVDPETYKEWYDERAERGGYRYWPDAAWREVVTALAIIVGVMLLAYIFGPKGPDAPPDPTMIAADPRPDWYFRWYYALLAVKPQGWEPFFMVYLPLGALIAMFLLPFVAPKGERHPKRRPWAILIVVVVVTALGVLTELGMRAPWAMEFETVPLSPEVVGVAEGPVWTGAQLFHERGCQFCHVAAGQGGQYGPDLTDVTRRLPPEMIVTRTINGIGQMPAYRDMITRDEMDAILAFLRSLEAPR